MAETTDAQRREALAKDFQKDLFEGYQLLKEQCSYDATYFLRMLIDHGGVGTARKLLASPYAQDGLERVRQEGMLKYSLENAVSQPKYRELFTEEERSTARKRLRETRARPEVW